MQVFKDFLVAHILLSGIESLKTAFFKWKEQVHRSVQIILSLNLIYIEVNYTFNYLSTALMT